MIPIYKPYLTKEILAYPKEALDSGWVSSKGPFVERTTELLQNLFGWKHVLLTSSGTAACHLAAIALAEHIGKSHNTVTTPNNVYVAAWNTLLQEHLRPHTVDADVETWNADLRNARFDHALIVHNVGNVVNVPDLLNSRLHHPLVIEDACEALFGTYNGRSVGTASLAASLSFYGNKTLTAGEGGALVTMHNDVYDLARSAANQGQTCQRYVHDCLGYNYRMTNVQAALLYGQLQFYQEIRNRKKHIFDSYRSRLPSKRVILPRAETGTEPADWIMAVRVMFSDFAQADRFFAKRGIEIRPMFPPVRAHRHLNRIAGSDHIASLLYKECFMLPSFPDMTDEQIDHVCTAVRDYEKSLS